MYFKTLAYPATSSPMDFFVFAVFDQHSSAAATASKQQHCTKSDKKRPTFALQGYHLMTLIYNNAILY